MKLAAPFLPYEALGVVRLFKVGCKTFFRRKATYFLPLIKREKRVCEQRDFFLNIPSNRRGGPRVRPRTSQQKNYQVGLVSGNGLKVRLRLLSLCVQCSKR